MVSVLTVGPEQARNAWGKGIMTIFQQDNPAESRGSSPPSMIRILLFGVLFAVLGIFWDSCSTLAFRTAFLGESVPPIPAFASLLLLVALRPLLKRIFASPPPSPPKLGGTEGGREGLGVGANRAGYSEGELLAAYGFLTIAVTVCFVNGLRTILELATVPHYGDPNDAALNFVRPHWPRWLAPTDPEALRWLYQGSPTQQVPWRAWLVPIACITGLLTLLHTATTSLFALLSRRWVREERLTYPVAELAISLVVPEGRPAAGGTAAPIHPPTSPPTTSRLPIADCRLPIAGVRTPENRKSQIANRKSAHLFRHRLFWLGAAAALAFNLFWMLPAMLPGARVPPQYTDLNALLPAGPWRAGYTWFIRYNPVVLGLGILVPTDVLFATWFSTLLFKAEAVWLATRGYGWDPTFHLAGRQGMGGYLMFAAFLLWTTRRVFATAVRSVWGKGREGERGEGRGRKGTEGDGKIRNPKSEIRNGVSEGREDALFLFLFLGSAVALMVAMVANGMAAWLAVVFVTFLLILALVNGRIRTQVGVPILYLHGGGALEGARGLLFLLGGSLLASTGRESVTALAAFSFPSLVTYLAPYQADGYRLAEASGLGRRRWAVLSVVAVACGVLISFWIQLSFYYRLGGETMNWPPSSWPIATIVSGVQPENLSPSHWLPVTVGFLMTAGCIVGQRFWVGWPFHPIGFITAGAIGGYIFAQSFLAWLIKALALRYLGLHAFVKLRQFFLGLVIGHFFLASVWGLLGVLDYAPARQFTIGFW